ncbi:MAG: acylphosphatase [Proteobacteria bacterium]|nr:acylphosphatase [Pseudomonadota bacterium]MBU1739300.1 acylphosphatase [Pseudomonadota bacterium]
MAKKRVHVVVHGKVQGVYFRMYAQAEGQKLGLGGWVKNRPDGVSIETAIEGDEEKVNQMLHWLEHEGSPGSEVTKIEIREERPFGETPGGYNIRY